MSSKKAGWLTKQGDVIANRYEVGPVIGSGGHSEVHAGFDLYDKRRVAIKLRRMVDSDGSLHPQDKAGQALERWVREELVGKLASHRGIVTVLDRGTDTSHRVDFLVMELLDGEDLDRRIAAEGRLPQQAVIARSVELADALASLHCSPVGKVLHRDIKPANVMLALTIDEAGTPTERAVLLDLGLCKPVQMKPITALGQLEGTLPYVAPELFGGGLLAASELSDIYALGATLYEAATGMRAFDSASEAALRMKIAKGDYSPLASVGLPLDEGLCDVIERCIERNPAARFQSAKELHDALRSLQCAR